MRILYVAVGVAIYFLFFATFLYLIGFLANIPGLPVSVDHGPVAAMLPALALDLLAIVLFGVQHSVMARQSFKRAWTKLIPEPLERSLYVLFSSLVLILLFVLWRPLPGIVWDIQSSIFAGILWAGFALGWAIVLLSTFLLSHFELFGLKQVYLNFVGRIDAAPQLRRPLFYRFVRHPLYSGFVIAFWVTPVMTYGHLLFAVGMTAYILLAIPHEERDLVGLFGDEYEAYRREVGMLAPGIGRRH